MGFSELLDSGEAMSLVLIWNLKPDLETFSFVLFIIINFLFLFFPSFPLSSSCVWLFLLNKMTVCFFLSCLYFFFPCFLTNSPSLALLALSLLILKKAYLFLCAPLAPPSKTKLSIGKGCVCSAGFGVTCSFWIAFVWGLFGLVLERCKKILGHFKEKGRNMINLDWITLLNAQCSQLPHFILFLKNEPIHKNEAQLKPSYFPLRPKSKVIHSTNS